MIDPLHGAHSVLVDTNLLVLYVAGTYDPSLVERHKRLRNYDLDALVLLTSLLASRRTLMTTPHVLAEVSNLLRQIGDPLRLDLTACLGQFISNLDERHGQAVELAQMQAFVPLGVTDTAIFEAAFHSGCVWTDDLQLYLCLERAALKVVNFNHLRV